MSAEKASQNADLEKLLSRKSNLLSDFDRKNRMEDIKKSVVSFVDEKCKLHGKEALQIHCHEDSINKRVLSFFILKNKDVYEIGLEFPFFVQLITFKHSKGFKFKEDQGSDVFFCLTPKGNNSTQMTYRYEDQPDVTFDGLVETFSTIIEIDEMMDPYDEYEEDFKRYGY